MTQEAIAELLEGCRHVTVGASSPVPGAGALRSGSRLFSRSCLVGELVSWK